MDPQSISTLLTLIDQLTHRSFQRQTLPFYESFPVILFEHLSAFPLIEIRWDEREQVGHGLLDFDDLLPRFATATGGEWTVSKEDITFTTEMDEDGVATLYHYWFPFQHEQASLDFPAGSDPFWELEAVLNTFAAARLSGLFVTGEEHPCQQQEDEASESGAWDEPALLWRYLPKEVIYRYRHLFCGAR